MNHINWVQQDPDYQTKYHVLKWIFLLGMS